MKRQMIRSLLLIMALCLTAISADAQRDRNYVKSQIKNRGNVYNRYVIRTN